MHNKISVIIPVYNAGKYLVQCIESLLSQSLQECEFIFINDGSRDNSRQIIEAYQKLDQRIKLTNQENQGVSVARNVGLSIATGEYIGFVDSDDYIEKDMYEVLYNSAKQGDCDVVISNFESEIEGRRLVTRYHFPVDTVLNKHYIDHEILPYFIEADNLNTACNKIFKNKVVNDNNIEFPKKVVLGEDAMFNILFFGKATTMKYTDYTGYHYREVIGSATRSILEKDYFSRALEVHSMEFPENHIGEINTIYVQRLKSIKLIKSVMSYIYIYFSPSKEINFSKRYKYVRKMISDNNVRQALNICYSEIYGSLGRYDKLIINMIKRKCTFGLYFATAYSRYRNSVGGI